MALFLENLSELRMFLSYKDLVDPLAYRYFCQMYEIAPIQKRPKLEHDFHTALKSLQFFSRTDELTMLKLEKCLQRGQVERFKRICDTLRLTRSIRCPLVPAAQELKTYLERISKLQNEGHTVNNARKLLSSEIYDFSRNDSAFVYPLKIASELDSGNNLLALQVSLI